MFLDEGANEAEGKSNYLMAALLTAHSARLQTFYLISPEMELM